MSRRIADAVQRVYDAAKRRGAETRLVAAEAVREMPREEIEAMAVEFIVDSIARSRRKQTREIEVRSERRLISGRRPRKGTIAWSEWASTQQGRDVLAAEDAAEIAASIKFHGVLKRALDRYTEELHLDWTRELLDAEFVLPDGTVATWGAATVQQHEARRDDFMQNAHVNMEGAARHQCALDALASTSASCLNDAQVVAA